MTAAFRSRSSVSRRSGRTGAGTTSRSTRCSPPPTPGDDDDEEVDADAETLVEPTTVRRPDLEYAWVMLTAPDRENGRPILTRQLMARARGVQPLITFDSYASREGDFRPVWEHLIATLRLGSPVNLLGDAMN